MVRRGSSQRLAHLVLSLALVPLLVPGPAAALDSSGPQVVAAHAEPSVLAAGQSPLVVEATIDDSDTGGSIITAGWVSVPSVGLALPMDPLDGVFDSSREEVTAALPSALWPISDEGGFEIEVVGTDSAGNNGTPLSLVVVVVPSHREGPAVLAIIPAVDPLPAGSLALLVAITVDPAAPADGSGATVRAVSWSLGPLPLWDQGEVLTVDADGDGIAAEANLTIATSNWTAPLSPYRLWVRAADSLGNWGPASFVDLSVGPRRDTVGPLVVGAHLSSPAVTEAIAATQLLLVLDDTSSGTSAIASGEFAIGDPPHWPGLPLQAADGAFDGSVEGATGTVDLQNLAPRTNAYALWVRGIDSAGNVGRVVALSVWRLPLPQHGQSDGDADGVVDGADPFPKDPQEWRDSDSDGVGDNADLFPGDADEWADADSDGVGDSADAFPFDPQYWQDTDGDGRPDPYEVWLHTDPVHPDLLPTPPPEREEGVEAAIATVETVALLGGAIAVALSVVALCWYVAATPRRLGALLLDTPGRPRMRSGTERRRSYGRWRPPPPAKARDHSKAGRKRPRKGRRPPSALLLLCLLSLAGALTPTAPGFPTTGSSDSSQPMESCTFNSGCHDISKGPGGAQWEVTAFPAAALTEQEGLDLRVRVDLSGTGGEGKMVGVMLLDDLSGRSIVDVTPHFRIAADPNGNDPPRSYNQRPRNLNEPPLAAPTEFVWQLIAPDAPGTYVVRIAIFYDDGPATSDKPIVETVVRSAVITPAPDHEPPLVLIDGADPTVVVQNVTSTTTVVGTASDIGQGQSVLRSIEYALGPSPSWPGLAVVPDDGIFDSPTEPFSFEVPTSTWLAALSPYTVWVRATDSQGNVAPGSSIEVQVVAASGDSLGPLTLPREVPGPVPDNATTVTVRVLLDEQQRGQSTVAAAQFSLGPRPSWPGTNLSADDGAFDSSQENATATIDGTALPAGTPLLLWVRGRDAKGTWGPPLALPLLRNASADLMGPMVRAIRLEPQVLRAGAPAVLRVDLLDEPSSGGVVAGAEHVLSPSGTPAHWPGLPLGPLDGWANGSSESFAAALQSTGLDAGDYQLWVRGRDRGGALGPASSIVLQVLAPPPPPTEVVLVLTTDPSPPLEHSRSVELDLRATVADPSLAVVSLQVRLTGEAWRPLSPHDGAFDGPGESGLILLDGTFWSAGTTPVVIEARAGLPDGSFSPVRRFELWPATTPPDRDGDHVLDSADAFPADPARSVDTDLDGRDDREEGALGLDPSDARDGNTTPLLLRPAGYVAPQVQTRRTYLGMLQVVAAVLVGSAVPLASWALWRVRRTGAAQSVTPGHPFRKRPLWRRRR